GPGHAAGLRAGDIVARLSGEPVRDMADFRNTVAQAGPGTTVKLELWRGGQTHAVSVELGVLPGSEEGPARRPSKAHAEPAVQSLGLAFEDPDPRLRSQLDLPKGGAVITEVEPGSIADEAGLRRGDVVVQVAGQRAASATDAQRRIERGDLGQGVRIRVQRGPYGRFVVLRRHRSP
ncbi:MAG: PDZ domain-containing protein, partial [Myxococcales bacterium]|nr:PDZ domain-containing protein [Myxococcales bacterium]